MTDRYCIDGWIKRRRVNERAENFYETTTAEAESGASVSGVLRSKREWPSPPPVVCYQEDRDLSRLYFLCIMRVRAKPPPPPCLLFLYVYYYICTYILYVYHKRK